MAEQQQDQSMEEILQSIKRIIAEEGEAAPAGSDVLELNEMVSAPQPAAPEPNVGTMSLDEIMAAPVAPEAPMPAPMPAPIPAAAMPAPKPEPAPAMAEDVLASTETIQKSASAMEALRRIPSPEMPPLAPSGVGFRSGTTIESLVLEGLKPMLKEWLDANLPGMVERLVEREIKRLSTR